MAKTLRLPKEEPLLNIASYARGGSRAADRLTPAQIEHISLTVNRAPEVMVKVLSQASNDVKAVGRHVDYIGRQGGLNLEGDEGEQLSGRAGKALLEDWGLEIDEKLRQGGLTSLHGRKPPKLVHKLVFSMPSGTPRQKVLGAVRNFAREEFYGQHRYAMVLHTDEPHPHVHLVLKAMSEQGLRLNIRKATLRHWRSQFAHHLRELGVVANATERAVRGESRKSMKDGIYRASRRGESTYMRARVEAIASELSKRGNRVECGNQTLLQTRASVVQGWQAAADQLSMNGNRQLAVDLSNFVVAMKPPRTDREQMADKLLQIARTRQRDERVR